MKSQVICIRDLYGHHFEVRNGDLRIRTITWRRAMTFANAWARSPEVQLGGMPFI